MSGAENGTPDKTNVRRQMLKLREGGPPILIATPVGVIEIRRMTKDVRNLEFTLPKQMEAVLGHEKLMRNRFLLVDQHGVKPKFHHLVPIHDEEGNLVGVDVPEGIRLVEEPEGDQNNGTVTGRTSELENGPSGDHGS